MFVGPPNPNVVMPLEKLSITNQKTKAKFYVLYNPERYVQARQVMYSGKPGMATNMPILQFAHGTQETLSFSLFFDSMSAGAEVGGTMADKAKFAANSLLPTAAKFVDVRDYTKKVYNLMLIEPSLHAPPLLKLEWSSLQFTGYLASCKQTFTKFSETGMPVRANLDCEFQQFVEPSKISALSPNESPDTTKYRVVTQGDALWSFSAREYGQPDRWREIAAANGIANPRLLCTGDTLVFPGLD